MEKINAELFIKSLDINPPFEKIYDFADRLGCWHKNPKGEFERHVYIRGPVLYSIIAKLKPKTVLEFGTGLGYSSLCMAKAMHDFDIDGKIYTVDRFSMNYPHQRYLKDHAGKIISVKKSNNESWSQAANQEWIKKIIPLTGHSGPIMKKTKLPKIEFSYIDAGHNYESVKHDFYSLLTVAAKNFNILFDDYIKRPFYGITKLVDEEIIENFDATLIETDMILTSSTKEQRQGMILVNSETAKKPINEIFPKDRLENYLSSYRRYDQFVTANRHKLNEIIPGLKQVRFKFWKKINE